MKIDIVYAIAAAPIVTLLLGWVLRSIRRMPQDIKEMFLATTNWVRG
jgi:hypothetical protein